MINDKKGCRPIKNDHRDYDFHKSFQLHKKFAGFSIPVKPDFNFDLEKWMPSQDTINAEFPNLVPMFEGCTNFSTSDVCADQDGKLYNPMGIEAITHANAQGGGDVRQSLLSTVNYNNALLDQNGVLGDKRKAVYRVTQLDGYDWFDSIQTAMDTVGDEERSVSTGTCWLRNWDNAPQGIVPENADYSTDGLSWHNWKICGQKTINGVPYLIGKTWQGTTVGDNGWLYFSRQTINNVMQIAGTGAFVVTKLTPPQIQTVELSLMEELISKLRVFLNFLLSSKKKL